MHLISQPPTSSPYLIMPCAASGKTQLCLMAAAHTVSRGERVVYIDTSNAFSARRLVEIMSLVAGAQLVSRAGQARGWAGGRAAGQGLGSKLPGLQG